MGDPAVLSDFASIKHCKIMVMSDIVSTRQCQTMLLSDIVRIRQYRTMVLSDIVSIRQYQTIILSDMLSISQCQTAVVFLLGAQVLTSPAVVHQPKRTNLLPPQGGVWLEAGSLRFPLGTKRRMENGCRCVFENILGNKSEDKGKKEKTIKNETEIDGQYALRILEG